MKHVRLSFEADESRIESTSRYVLKTPVSEQIIEDIEEYQAKYDIGATHFKNKNATPMKMRPIPVTSSAYEAPKTKRNLLETSMPEFRKYYVCEKRAANEDLSEDRPRTSQTRNRDSESLKSPHTSLRVAEERPSTPIVKTSISSDLPRTSLSLKAESIERNETISPKNKNDTSTSQKNTDVNGTRDNSQKIIKGITKKDLRQARQDKAKELEILKQNINKIYNLTEKTTEENSENYKETENPKWKNEVTAIIEESITETSRDHVTDDPGNKNDTNLLRIEVQSVTQVNDVKITDSQTQDLLLIVESSNAEPSDTDYPEDIISTQMTILVSPKSNSDEPTESTGEKATRLRGRDVLNSLYQTDPNENISSVHMQLNNSKDVFVPFLSDIEINEEEDNYTSLRSDGDRSPVSMAKTSEDDNFWDS